MAVKVSSTSSLVPLSPMAFSTGATLTRTSPSTSQNLSGCRLSPVMVWSPSCDSVGVHVNPDVTAWDIMSVKVNGLSHIGSIWQSGFFVQADHYNYLVQSPSTGVTWFLSPDSKWFCADILSRPHLVCRCLLWYPDPASRTSFQGSDQRRWRHQTCRSC